jgi:hypothetical protein
MFHDIIRETNQLFHPEGITESVAESRYNLLSYLSEMATMPLHTHGVLSEADVPDIVGKQKGIIRRLIEFFARMIHNIKTRITARFQSAEERLNTLQKYLRTIDHRAIQINTRMKINSFDRVLDSVFKIEDELRANQLNNLMETFFKMGKVEKGMEVIKAAATKGKSIADRFSGYVPSMVKYNGKNVEQIRDELLGEIGPTTNIQTEKFFSNLERGKKFKNELDKLVAEYSKVLNGLSAAAEASDKMQSIGPNGQHMFNSIVNTMTSFFNRNVHLVTSLVLEIIDTTQTAAFRMVATANTLGLAGAAEVLRSVRPDKK